MLAVVGQPDGQFVGNWRREEIKIGQPRLWRLGPGPTLRVEFGLVLGIRGKRGRKVSGGGGNGRNGGEGRIGKGDGGGRHGETDQVV